MIMCMFDGSWVVLFMLVVYLVAMTCLFFCLEKKYQELSEKANDWKSKYVALKSAERLKKSDTK